MINGLLDGTTTNGPFLQLFAITGGSGQYVGAKGIVTIDPTLGLQDFQIRFEKETEPSTSWAVESASWSYLAAVMTFLGGAALVV